LSRSIPIETQNFFHNTRQNSVFTAVCTNRGEPSRFVPIRFDSCRFVSILTFSFRSNQIETNLPKFFYFNGINTKNSYFCPLRCVINKKSIINKFDGGNNHVVFQSIGECRSFRGAYQCRLRRFGCRSMIPRISFSTKICVIDFYLFRNIRYILGDRIFKDLTKMRLGAKRLRKRMQRDFSAHCWDCRRPVFPGYMYSLSSMTF